MPTRLPQKSDFPPSLTLTITNSPPTTSSNQLPTNILLLLHGLGDTHAPFTNIATSLNLPETTIVTLQAPAPLPFDLPGFHWGDDINFDSRTGALDMDAGFARTTRLCVREIILDVLVRKCGYGFRDIHLLGFGQGGMASLVTAREVQVQLSSEVDSGGDGGGGRWLGGVISIGAAYPLSRDGDVRTSSRSGTNRTPVLLLSGRDSEAVTESAVKRTKGVFEFVEVERYARRGDTMPKSRDEMLPVMRFLARRLRSYKGVPEGSVEIS